MNLKIGLDLDGVIIDHTISKIKSARKKSYTIKPTETTSEIMKGLMPLSVYRTIQNDIYGEKGLSSKPMKKTKKTLKKIVELFPAHVISRRGIHHGQTKFALRWLKNNKFFPPLNRKRILFVKSDEKKDDLCKQLNINVYLDDKMKVLGKLPSVKYRVLFDPYGHRYKNPPKGMKVVKTWPEFFKYLLKLSKS